jgi:nucleoside-diphosphate kinase
VADSQQFRERTLVVLKPDAVVRGLAGRIIQRFEDASMKIIGVKMRELDADFTRKHYFDLEERTGPVVYNATAEFMQRGPVIAFVVEGEDAVATVRKIDPRRLRAPDQGRSRCDRQGGSQPRARLR